MKNGNPVRIFCSDLDGTLLGEPAATVEFGKIWRSHAESRALLVYSSGRLLEDAREQVRLAGLPDPDFFIGGVGTMIFDAHANHVLPAFSDLLDEGWDLPAVSRIVGEFPEIEAQPAQQQHPWKSSWFWHERPEEDLEALRNSISAAGLHAQVIYSSRRDLDVLPKNANKGNALEWLCDHLKIPLTEAVVAGDTGNDSSMFLLPGVRGIAVENAGPDLLSVLPSAPLAHHAQGLCADGVISGLRHFGLFPEIPAKR